MKLLDEEQWQFARHLCILRKVGSIHNQALCVALLCFAYTDINKMNNFLKKSYDNWLTLFLKSGKSLIKIVLQYLCEGEKTEL